MRRFFHVHEESCARGSVCHHVGDRFIGTKQQVSRKQARVANRKK
ncbi:hypothetical protein HMPREF1861_01817 [Corynebacterium kroppenstedtii]|nr:hypothetical protein HMPREF1861_01817 [Corynebacterium kroppenstedtii]